MAAFAADDMWGGHGHISRLYKAAQTCHRNRQHRDDLWRAGALLAARRDELDKAERRLIDAVKKSHKRRKGYFPSHLRGRMATVVKAQEAYDRASEEYDKIYNSV